MGEEAGVLNGWARRSFTPILVEDSFMVDFVLFKYFEDFVDKAS